MQTESNFARESRDMPETRFSLMARFRAAGLKCIALLCQSSKSSGTRTRCAAATRGTEVSVLGVKPSRYAALLSEIEAVKSSSPWSRKRIDSPKMRISKRLDQARKSTDNRLLRKSGTCKTLVKRIGRCATPFTRVLHVPDLRN